MLSRLGNALGIYVMLLLSFGSLAAKTEQNTIDKTIDVYQATAIEIANDNITLQQGSLFHIQPNHDVYFTLPFAHELWFDVETSQQENIIIAYSYAPGVWESLGNRDVGKPFKLSNQFNRDLIVKVSNSSEETSELNVLLLQKKQPRPFMPLNWKSSSPIAKLSLDNQTVAFGTSNSPFSMTSENWNLLQFTNKRSDIEDEAQSVLFNNNEPPIKLTKPTSLKQSWEDNNGVSYVLSKPILSHKQQSSITTQTLFDSNTLSRQANLQEDWLFSANFSQYAEPALNLLNQPFLYDKVKNNIFASDFSIVSSQNIPPNVSYKTPVLSSKQPILRKALQVTSLKWATNLWQPKNDKLANIRIKPVKLKNAFLKKVFYVGTEQQKIDIKLDSDAISNQVRLEFLLPNDKLGAQPNAAHVEVWANNKRLHSFAIARPESLLTETSWQQQDAFVSNQMSSILMSLPNEINDFQLRFSETTHFRVHYQVADDGQVNSQVVRALMSSPDSRKELKPYNNFLDYQDYLVQSWQTALPEDIWLPIIHGQIEQLPLTWEYLQLANGMDDIKKYRPIFNLLAKAQSMDSSYWVQLTSELNELGFNQYATNLWKAVTLYHPNKDIKRFAVQQLLSQYDEQQKSHLRLQIAAYASKHQIVEPFFFAKTLLENGLPLFSLFAYIDNLHDRQQHQSLNIDFKGTKDNDDLLYDITKVLLFLDDQAIENNRKSKNENLTQKSSSPVFSSVKFTSLISVRNLKRQSQYLAYLLSPNSRLSLTSSGAREFNVTLRLLAKDGQVDDDWLKIKINQAPYWLPINQSESINPNLSSDLGPFSLSFGFTLNLVQGDTVEFISGNDSYAIEINERYSTSVVNSGTCVVPHVTSVNDNGVFVPCIYNLETHTPDNDKETNKILLVDTPSHEALMKLLQMQRQFEQSRLMSDLNQLVKSLREAEIIAEQTNDQNLHTALVKIQSRLSRHTKWQVINNPLQTSGIFNYDTDKTYIDFNTLRKALLYKNYKNTADDLYIGQTLQYEIPAPYDNQYRVKIDHLSNLFSSTNPALIEIYTDDDTRHEIRVATGETSYFDLPKTNNKQLLALNLVNELGFRTGKVQTQLQKRVRGNWQDVKIDSKRRLYQSTPQIPLQFFIAEAQWIRIDNYTTNGVQSSIMRFAPYGLFNWSISSRNTLGHRVYRLVPAFEQNNKPILNAVNNALSPNKTHEITAKKPSIINRNRYYPKNTVLQTQHSELPKLTPYTYGAEYTWSQTQEEEDILAATETTNNLQVYLTRKQANDVYYQVKGGTKTYTKDLEPSAHLTLAAVNILDNQHWLLSPTWYARIDMGQQKSATNEEKARYLKATSRFEWQYSWYQKFNNKFSINVWYRDLSTLDVFEHYSSSVISEYKSQHKNGLQLNDTFRWKLRQDAEIYTSFQIDTNPVDQTEWLDNLHLDSGFKLYYKNVELHTAFEYRLFNQDINRSIKQEAIRFKSSLQWHTWFKDKKLGLKLTYLYVDLLEENIVGLSMSFSNTNGRGYRDYLPNQHSFRAIKNQAFVLNGESDFD